MKESKKKTGKKSALRWTVRIAAGLVVLLVVAAGVLSIWAYSTLKESLPQLEGEISLDGLSAPVIVERDEIGVPTIRGENAKDVYRALGFVHGQDRFFQMDLMRRQAAGELAELIGEPVVKMDLSSRIHQFRKRAKNLLASLSQQESSAFKVYTQGINAGLHALESKPFEYYLLSVEPEPWKEEDCVLVLMSMFFELNDENGRLDSNFGLLSDLLNRRLADFIAPDGTEWDAPVVGPPIASDSIPGPEIIDLRKNKSGLKPASSGDGAPDSGADSGLFKGSNNWAVAGSRTKDGRAILAVDMHLGISVPNTWYRAMLKWPANKPEIQVSGVTLPGLPTVVVGSNTHVAWGFTNSYGDWVDLVVLEIDPNDPNRYLTPDGYKSFEVEREEIRVKGKAAKKLEVKKTIWGPVVDKDHNGNPRALRWTAHDVEGVNSVHSELAEAKSLEQALEISNRSGIPPQNFVCVDKRGRIAWTIEGRIPRRVGFDGKLPVSFADGTRKWGGYLSPEEYPRVVDPEGGMIWTANSRVVDGEMLKKIGWGGYGLGARAKQIRDDLEALERAGEADMLAIQLDDRALFLERWRKLILEILTEKSMDGKPGRKTFRGFVESGWTGRASVDSVGYRLVAAFRSFAEENVFEWLTMPCKKADERFHFGRFQQREQPLWLMVTERPMHLLSPKHNSWEDFLLSMVDVTIEYYGGAEKLDAKTWGNRNTAQIKHPISRAVPMLSSFLDMPTDQLPGDTNMPRVQGPDFGASERMAVSPGRESEGYMHMPTGQSGHPLSPFYSAGHEAWVKGEPIPFLPGETTHTLRMVPN